ncbi:MAG: hypothetical protein GC192_23545 [Bacteroidetes bacterium]|nr:hypothetical protein [Bacteroidota bacterium]
MKIKPLPYRLVDILAKIISSPEAQKKAPKSVLKLLQANRMAILRAKDVHEEKRIVEIILHDGVEVKTPIGSVAGYNLPPYPVRKDTKGKDANFAQQVKEISELREQCNIALGNLSETSSGVTLKGEIPRDDFNLFLMADGTVDILDIEDYIQIKEAKKED